MIETEIMKLCRKILEKHKAIRDSNFYELSFIYDFESGKANVLKIMKRNQDFIAFRYENIDAEFDIERCEDDCCDIVFGCDIENCLIALNEFLEDEETIKVFSLTDEQLTERLVDDIQLITRVGSNLYEDETKPVRYWYEHYLNGLWFSSEITHDELMERLKIKDNKTMLEALSIYAETNDFTFLDENKKDAFRYLNT